jgi:hypothetical protein
MSSLSNGLPFQVQIVAPKSGNVSAVKQQIQSGLGNINANIQLQNAASTNRQINSITSSTQKATKETKSFGEAIGLAGRNFAAYTSAVAIVGRLSIALSRATRDAIKFEREFVKLAQVLEVNVGDLKGLSKEISQLSREFGLSANIIAKTSVILAQSGLNAREVAVALRTLSKTTLASTFNNIAQTTEGAIAIISQFGQGASALEKQLGAVNAVTKSYAAESSDLIEAVRRGGAAFVAAGGDFEEFIALFTSVRSTTRESAETISTGFRTIFARLQRPQTLKFFKDLDIQLVNMDGTFVGAFEAIRRISEGLDKLNIRPGQTRFAQIVEEVGGIRQSSRVIPLLTQFKKAEEALGVARKGGLSIDADVAKAQETTAQAIERTRQNFAALIREITQTSSFKALIGFALALANAFTEIARTLKPLIPIIATLGAIKLGSILNSAVRTGFTAPGLGSRRPFADGGPVLGFNRGGSVPGSGNGDTVPAMLEPGEFVIRKSAVQAFGVGGLADINKYKLGGIAKYKGSTLTRTYPSLKNKVEPKQDYSAQVKAVDVSKNPTVLKHFQNDPRNIPNWEKFEFAVSAAYPDAGKPAKGNSFLDYPNKPGEAKLMKADQVQRDENKRLGKGNNNITMLAKLIGSGLYGGGKREISAYYPSRPQDFQKKALGGSISGAGTDTVPALLTPGEFVINKKSAQAFGYGGLAKINKYAKGGPVGVQHFQTGGEVKDSIDSFIKSLSEAAKASKGLGRETDFSDVNKARKKTAGKTHPDRIANTSGVSDELGTSAFKSVDAIKEYSKTLSEATKPTRESAKAAVGILKEFNNLKKISKELGESLKESEEAEKKAAEAQKSGSAPSPAKKTELSARERAQIKSKEKEAGLSPGQRMNAQDFAKATVGRGEPRISQSRRNEAQGFDTATGSSRKERRETGRDPQALREAMAQAERSKSKKVETGLITTSKDSKATTSASTGLIVREPESYKTRPSSEISRPEKFPIATRKSSDLAKRQSSEIATVSKGGGNKGGCKPCDKPGKDKCIDLCDKTINKLKSIFGKASQSSAKASSSSNATTQAAQQPQQQTQKRKRRSRQEPAAKGSGNITNSLLGLSVGLSALTAITTDASEEFQAVTDGLTDFGITLGATISLTKKLNEFRTKFEAKRKTKRIISEVRGGTPVGKGKASKRDKEERSAALASNALTGVAIAGAAASAVFTIFARSAEIAADKAVKAGNLTEAIAKTREAAANKETATAIKIAVGLGIAAGLVVGPFVAVGAGLAALAGVLISGKSAMDFFVKAAYTVISGLLIISKALISAANYIPGVEIDTKFLDDIQHSTAEAFAGMTSVVKSVTAELDVLQQTMEASSERLIKNAERAFESGNIAFKQADTQKGKSLAINDIIRANESLIQGFGREAAQQGNVVKEQEAKRDELKNQRGVGQSANQILIDKQIIEINKSLKAFEEGSKSLYENQGKALLANISNITENSRANRTASQTYKELNKGQKIAVDQNNIIQADSLAKGSQLANSYDILRASGLTQAQAQAKLTQAVFGSASAVQDFTKATEASTKLVGSELQTLLFGGVEDKLKSASTIQNTAAVAGGTKLNDIQDSQQRKDVINFSAAAYNAGIKNIGGNDIREGLKSNIPPEVLDQFTAGLTGEDKEKAENSLVDAIFGLDSTAADQLDATRANIQALQQNTIAMQAAINSATTGPPPSAPSRANLLGGVVAGTTQQPGTVDVQAGAEGIGTILEGVVAKFEKSAETFLLASQTVPQKIDMSLGDQSVNVNMNGAEMMTALMPEMQNIALKSSIQELVEFEKTQANSGPGSYAAQKTGSVLGGLA